MSNQSLATDFAQEAMKGAPPATVAATTLIGLIDWQVWVLILTALYLVMQMVLLGWKLIDRAIGRHRPGD